MSSAGVATPQTLSYASVVDVNMSATNDVNFADIEDYGHRVQVNMGLTAVNNYLGWSRAAGADRPTAKLTTANEAAFKTAIETALGTTFVDIDGITGGLHFGTTNFNINTDTRKRPSGVTCSANDLPMCFVLYKLYGSSAPTTLNKVYNLEDAHGMLTNSAVSTAIVNSFKAAEATALDTMFRDLLAADPTRFFDSSGVPVAGIFEINADVAGSGTWKMVVNDIIEVKLKLIFASNVTRRGVAGGQHNLTAPTGTLNTAEDRQETVIEPNDFFYVRLQLKLTADSGQTAQSGGSGGSGGTGGGTGSSGPTYQLIISNFAVTGFTGTINGELIIPPEVLQINDFVFQDQLGITSVNLNNVRFVLQGAFKRCTNLVTVTNGQLTSIGYGAFEQCSFSTIKLGGSGNGTGYIQLIDQYAFASNPNLSSVIYTSIGGTLASTAFYDTPNLNPKPSK